MPSNEKTLCQVIKPFGEYIVGDRDYFTEDEVKRWGRKGRIREIKEAKADRSRLGPAPHSPTDQKGRVVIPDVVADDERAAKGPTETVPDKPSEKPDDDKPEKAPEVGPSKTPRRKVPTIEKRHHAGPWYHVYVAGTAVTKKDGEPRSFYSKDADEYIAELRTGVEK